MVKALEILVKVVNIQRSCRPLSIEDSVLYATGCHTVSYAEKLFHLALQLPIECIICCLWRCHHRQGHLLNLARLACIVIHNSRTVWSQARQEVIGRQAHSPGKHPPVPEFQVECEAQVTTNIELRRYYLNHAATICQKFCYASRLVEANLIVYQHVFSCLSTFLTQEDLPGRRYMRQLSTWYRWQAGAGTRSDNHSIRLPLLHHGCRHLNAKVCFNPCFEQFTL